MKGFFGWWTLDSDGDQDFSIDMVNATFSYRMHMDVVDGWESFRYVCFNRSYAVA